MNYSLYVIFHMLDFSCMKYQNVEKISVKDSEIIVQGSTLNGETPCDKVDFSVETPIDKIDFIEAQVVKEE